MRVAHNLMSNFTARQLNINTNVKSKSAERLGSGYKINRASDNAAGLSISEKMRGQIRGLEQASRNVQDGISLCQVADGALAEVSEMMQRITELSVQAANDTNTEMDREAIQKEINQLLQEIDHIGQATEFNKRPIFQGYDKVMLDASGNSIQQGDIPYSDFSLADIDLGRSPFSASSDADTLRLQAIVNNSASAANGKDYHLIYGDGSTSSSSFRITYATGQTEIVQMSSLRATDCSYNSATNEWSRKFNYTQNGNDLTIIQKVGLDTTNANEKNYIISYEIKNNSNEDTKIEFLFHADTAYNNNDRCEGYFVDKTRVTNYCVYSESTGSPLTDNTNSAYVDKSGVPNSFSIVDVDQALAFSEKISFEGGTKPDSVSIGHYSRIDDWPYYSALDINLGQSTERADLGFSLYYNLEEIGGTQSKEISFKYGIVSTEADKNLDGITITKDTTITTEHLQELPLWIQSGAGEGSGFYIGINEMNTEVLGIRNLNVTTREGANYAIKKAQDALEKVLENRGKIGAQQNRLEYAKSVDDNTAENLQASESRIRDADMAG